MSYSLFVGDLPYDCGDDKLYQTFYEKFKSVQKVSIIRNEDGSSRGFGFVRFENEMEMKIALNQDIRIDNILLRTDVAHQNERRYRNSRHMPNYSQHPHNNNHHNHHNHHYPNSHRGNSSAPNNTYVNSKANLPGHYHQKTNNNLSPSGSTVLSTSSSAPAPAPTSATPPVPANVTTTTSTAGTSLADRVNNNNNGNNNSNNSTNSNTTSGINQSQQRQHQRQQLTTTENAQLLSEGHAIHSAVPNHPSSSLQFAPGDPYSVSNNQQNNNHANHTTGLNKLSRPSSHMNQPMAFVDSYGMFYDATSGMPLNMAASFNPAVSMPGGPIPNHGEGQMEQATAMMSTPNVYYPYGPPPSAFGYSPHNAMLPHSVPQAVQQQHGPSNPSRYNPNQQAGNDVNGVNGAQQPQPLYYMNYWNGQPFYYDQANTPGGPPSIYHPTIHPFFMSSAAFLPNAQTPQTFNTQQQQQLHQNSEVTPNHPLPRRQPSAPHQMPYGHGGEIPSTIVKNTTAPPVDIPSATSYNIESSNTNNTN